VKIGFLTHYFPPEIGAPSARIYEMAKNWVKSGHQVKAVTCFPNHPTGEIPEEYEGLKFKKEEMDGIEVYRNYVYATPNKGFIKKIFNHLSFMFSSVLFSLRKIGEIDITVVSSPTFFSIFSGYLFSLIKRTPFILEIRDLWPAAIVELGVLKNKFIISVLEAIELFFYRRADKIVVVTRSFKENLISRGIDAEKIEVITNGVDINFFKNKFQNKELLEKYNLEDKFIVEYIGAHGLSQALDKIIYAAEKLKEYEDIHFVFVGEGAEKEKIMDLSEELELNNITFISQKPKEMMPEFYNIADICLVPLKDVELFETFIPSKIFEIMACEKPIVASLSGETKSILDEAQSAVTVEPENIDQIAAAILEIKNNPQIAEEMGKKGREFVVENYSRSSLADKYLNVMNQAIEGK